MVDKREEAIRKRAYEIWDQEGRPHGQDCEHWLRAAAEIDAARVYGVTDDGKIYKFTDQAKVVEHAGHKVTVTGKVQGDTITVDKVKAS